MNFPEIFGVFGGPLASGRQPLKTDGSQNRRRSKQKAKADGSVDCLKTDGRSRG